jgi:hypothetical protein
MRLLSSRASLLSRCCLAFFLAPILNPSHPAFSGPMNGQQEAPKTYAPNAEVEKQLAILSSYSVGVTTLKDFYSDKWNAGDALRMKLGIVKALWGKNFQVEFDIGWTGHNMPEVSEVVQEQFESAQQLAEDGSKQSFSPSTFQRGGSASVTKIYAHLKFVGGTLTSIEKSF